MTAPPSEEESEPVVTAALPEEGTEAIADSSEESAEAMADSPEAIAEPTGEVDGSAEEIDQRDLSAMADPENAHDPVSATDEVSNDHTGLHTEEHSTGGPTPPSMPW